MLSNTYRRKLAALGLGLLASTMAFAQSGGEEPSDGFLVPGLSVSPQGPRTGAPKALPQVELTGEILFQVLASEVAAQRGALSAATGTSLELARFTRDPRLARRAVEFALTSGDLVRALDAAQVWVELDPADVEARQTSLSLAAAAGRIEGLGAALRSRIATASAAEKPAAIVEARRVLGRLEDRRRALDILDEALTDVRDLPEARMALARAAAAANDAPRALREARAAQAAQPDSEAAAALVLQTGIESEPDKVIAATRAFIASHPKARELRVLLVRALAQVQDVDGARAELDSMSRANPEDFEVLYMQGALAYQTGQLDDAEKYLKQYSAIEDQRAAAGQPVPTPPEGNAALLLRVQVAEEQKRYDDAYELLQGIQDPAAAFPARLRQAVIRAKQGRLDDARKVLAILDPRDTREGVQVAMTESQILRDANKMDEATKVLADANAKYPDNPVIMYDLAMLNEREGKIAEMETLLRRVIAVKPDHAHAYNALGYSLADRKLRLPEAKALVERALNLQPDDAFIIDSMGWVYYRMGDNARALSYLERAYSLRPDAEIAIHLGEVLWASGQQDKARQLWRDVSQKDPGNEALRTTLARLEATL